MMQAFRNSAKPLIYIVAISFFAWLVLDLSGLTGGTGLLTTTSVGKVNGKAIDSRVFQQAVSQATEERQRQSPGQLGLADMAQIRDQVWEQFIQDQLLADEYRRYGIGTTSAELAALIRTNPPSQLSSLADFQTDGKFDQTKYERWLASAVGQQYIPLLEAQYRTQLMQAKLAQHLTSALYVSDTELWERFRDQREMVKVGAVMIDPASAVPDSAVSVTPSEVQQYYAARRDSLKREPAAFLSFVQLDRRPIASDTAAALARAQSVRAEITGGAPFAEVARRESSDTVSGNRGGDLGEWTRGSFDPDFEKVAFAIPLNTVSEPVLSRFGYHLIEVSKRQGDKATGRHILIPIEVAGAHRDQLDARADSLENLAAERLDPAALDTAARVLGLPVQQIGPVIKNQPSGAPPDAAVWAFQAKAGEQSPVIETPAAYVIFRLDSLHPGGVPSLEQARAQIEARLRFEKKKGAARAAAKELAARARTGGLAAAAGGPGGRYEVLGPFNRINSPLLGGNAVGVAFGMKVGDIAIADGRDVLYVMQTLERTPADSSAFTTQLPSLRESALQNARALFLRQYMTALREKAEIVDNRDRIFKTAAQVEADAPVAPGTRR